MTKAKNRTHITQVGRVAVPVSDQDRALEFYLDKLGFEKRIDTPYGEGERWVEVAPSSSLRPSTDQTLPPTASIICAGIWRYFSLNPNPKETS